MKISTTHNKDRIPFLDLLINCIEERSAPQILPIKDEHIFRFSAFLMSLCNSSANSLLDLILFLTALPELFFIKKIYKPLLQDPFDIHHILNC